MTEPTNLPENVDEVYPDDPRRPGVKIHQAHHDEAHRALNDITSPTGPANRVPDPALEADGRILSTAAGLLEFTTPAGGVSLLAELDDVDVDAPNDFDALVFHAASGTWQPADITPEADPDAITHDGTPTVGDLLRVKSTEPLIVERTDDPAGGVGEAPLTAPRWFPLGNWRSALPGTNPTTQILSGNFLGGYPFYLQDDEPIDKIAIGVSASASGAAAGTKIELGIFPFGDVIGGVADRLHLATWEDLTLATSLVSDETALAYSKDVGLVLPKGFNVVMCRVHGWAAGGVNASVRAVGTAVGGTTALNGAVAESSLRQFVSGPRALLTLVPAPPAIPAQIAHADLASFANWSIPLLYWRKV